LCRLTDKQANAGLNRTPATASAWVTICHCCSRTVCSTYNLNVGVHGAADGCQRTKEVHHVVFRVVPQTGKETNLNTTLQRRFPQSVIDHRPKPSFIIRHNDSSTELRFYVPTDKTFRRRSSQSISRQSTEKLNQTQQKQTYILNKMYNNI